ncbi:MAG: type II toxin-antitoxin system VapC family toxin [Leptospiraceae bacterium]|jgi:tRNA(fMet)-specific endonuclease VapC|nr:type II toxin-antitoxin system VapC family toxin [Leptospiraceae bacterium]
MILCDTDILIEYLKDNSEICSKLEHLGDENLSISIITYAELIRGAFNKTEQAKIKKQIKSITVISLSDGISNQFQRILDLYTLSHKISIPDALIAATAIASDLHLFTRNVKDFRFIKGISMYVPN